MYNTLKKFILKLSPNFLNKYEFRIRNLFSILYFGNKVNCNICSGNFKQFIHLDNSDLLCPKCGSLGRHRRLQEIINETVSINKEDKILHFSPSKIIQKKLKEEYPHYLTSDFNGNIKADESYDITKIGAPNNNFDVIICYHVLEHIVDDFKAISELYRILKPNGRLIVQTPFKDGEIYENFSITSKEGRLKHFGQEDHVRIYSNQGLQKRLEKGGFTVQKLFFEEKPDNRHGFKTEECVLLCMK